MNKLSAKCTWVIGSLVLAQTIAALGAASARANEGGVRWFWETEAEGAAPAATGEIRSEAQTAYSGESAAKPALHRQPVRKKKKTAPPSAAPVKKNSFRAVKASAAAPPVIRLNADPAPVTAPESTLAILPALSEAAATPASTWVDPPTHPKATTAPAAAAPAAPAAAAAAAVPAPKSASPEEVYRAALEDLAGMHCPRFNGIDPVSVKAAFENVAAKPNWIQDLQHDVRAKSGDGVELTPGSAEGFPKPVDSTRAQYFELKDGPSRMRVAVVPGEKAFVCGIRQIWVSPNQMINASVKPATPGGAAKTSPAVSDGWRKAINGVSRFFTQVAAAGGAGGSTGGENAQLAR